MDTDAEAEISPDMDKPEIGELKSKPTFKIDLTRNNTTVSLVCSFISADQQEEGFSKFSHFKFTNYLNHKLF